MDFSKLNRLRQVEIPTHCPEDWSAMEGDEMKRFCDGCGCFVHNLSAMKADEAEDVLAQPGRTCARMTIDAKKGILTRDGWIPRMLLAGALAAAVAGCDSTSTLQGDAAAPPSTGTESRTLGKVQTPDQQSATMGTPASAPQVILGDAVVPTKKQTKKTTKQ